MVDATSWALEHRKLDFTGKDVLELGCGTGRHALSALAGGARSYVGIDGSQGMLETARGRIRDPRCRWQVADLTRSPDLGCALFDVALVVLVLEHIPDLDPPLRAISQALRPAGILRIVEIHPQLIEAGIAAHFEDAASGEVRFSSCAHSVAKIHEAIIRSGLAVDRLIEDEAEGALLTAVPRLAKHRGARVVLDLSAHRP